MAPEPASVVQAVRDYMPEPVAWRYKDARSNFRYRGVAPGFDKDYPTLYPEPLYSSDQLRAAIAAEREQMNGLRRSVAEVIGEDQDTWPDHGNAPLAIAATVALLHARCTRLEAELSTLREQLAESESERMESYRPGDKLKPVR